MFERSQHLKAVGNLKRSKNKQDEVEKPLNKVLGWWVQVNKKRERWN